MSQRQRGYAKVATRSVTINTVDVAPIATEIPCDQILFLVGDAPDTKFLRSHFVAEGRLSEAQTLRILKAGTELLSREPNLLEIPAPVTICGDIHGQFYDLLKVFDVAGGEPPKEGFVFLGDYVDRGYFSLEVYLYLLAMKLNHPDKIFLLRGNHECRHLTRHFTFRLECTKKYSERVYDECMESFDALPLAAVVGEQYFCVHAGLSPALKTPKDLNTLNRFQEIPKQGLMCDLLWSDPTEDFGSESDDDEFTQNTARGCSYRYSFVAVCKFLKQNNLLSVIRGHEAQDAGYRLYRKAEKSEFPALITVFSAANYVDVYKNKGAVIKYDGYVMNIRQYNAAPHPYTLPKFMNVFDWSLPFVADKVASLLMALLNVQDLSEKLPSLTADQRQALEVEKSKRIDTIRSKIKAVGRLSKMIGTVRNQRETLAELRNAMGTKIIPARYLTLGEEDLRRVIRGFPDAHRCDQENEMMPIDCNFEEDDARSIVSLALSDSQTELTKEMRDQKQGEITSPSPPMPQNNQLV